MFNSFSVIYLLFVGAVISAPNSNESFVKQFIILASDEYTTLFSTRAKAYFDGFDTVENENIKSENVIDSDESDSSSEEFKFEGVDGQFTIFDNLAYTSKLKEVADTLIAWTNTASQFPVDEYEDEEIKIGIWKLKTSIGLLALGDEYYKEWRDYDFDDHIKKESFCGYKSHGKKKCDASFAQFRKNLFKTNDYDEILYYWKEFREQNLSELKEMFPKFIEIFKKLAEKYRASPKFTWYSRYLDENFGEEMEKVVLDMQPLYKELHAYIRHILHETYGDKVPDDGLIPHHLYEWAMSHAWKHSAVVAKEFKAVKMPIQNNFNSNEKTIEEIASEFMKSMGLSEISAEFWNERVREEKDTGDCEAAFYDAGKVTYLQYCKGVSIKKFLQMHGYMARVYYSNEHKDLPFAYSGDTYDIDVAVGEAIILSAGTPKYLHAIGLKDVDVLRPIEEMNRLYRMGVHTLLSIPEYFVHSKMVADILDGKVSLTEMNKHYWDLMKRYVGVAPPVERSPESIDLPHRFYKLIEENGQATKFVAENMGYQIYEALCKEADEYVEGDPSRPLHTCSLYQNTNAGKLLQSMMKVGAKKSWKEVLGIVTGDNDGMKAAALLHYYEPLEKWLQNKNKARGVKVGW